MLIDELREKYHFTGAKAGQPQNWYSFSSGISGITYGANFCQGEKARTEVYIDLGDQEKNKQVFDFLYQNASLIEKEFQDIVWERLDDKRASRLALYIDGSIESPDSELEEIRSWHIDKLLQLKKSLTPILRQAVQSV